MRLLRADFLLLLYAATTGVLLAETARIEPAGQFDIGTSISAGAQVAPVYVHAFLARAQGLYFLTSSSPHAATASTLVHTDDDGRYIGSILIGGASSPEDRDRAVRSVDVDDSGNVVVLREDGRTVSMYRDDGTQMSTVSLDRPAFEICWVGSESIILFTDGSVGPLRPASSPPFAQTSLSPLSTSFETSMAALSGSRLAILKGHEAELDLFEVGNKVFTAISLLGNPEIESSQSFYARRSGRGVLVNGVAAGPEGDLYLSLTGYPMSGGAAVLRLNARGQIQQSLRYILPKAEGSKQPGNPEGYLLPRFIGIRGARLFVASPNGQVAYYARY